MPTKIIIIEDSPTQAKEFAGQLSAHDVDVIIANDGPQGLRLVKSHQPDLVVLDINLPSMDGYQVCRRLKRDPETADIPVVMLTSSDSSGDIIEGINAGAVDYIPKDAFAVENLLGCLSSLGLIAPFNRDGES